VTALFVSVAKSEGDDVFWNDQRSSPFDIGKERGTTSGRERQLHRRRFTGRFGVGLVVVGVAVDEEQPEAASPPQGQRGSEQDRTVAAEDDGKLSAREDVLDGIGQPRTPAGDRVRVQRARFGIALARAWRRLDASGVSRAQPLGETMAEKRARQPFDAGRRQPERRRRLDDRVTPPQHWLP
jgi:hypothetical protein